MNMKNISKKSLKIALLGYGKMGKEIEKIALERGHEIVFKFDITEKEDLNTANLRKADVAFEFTQPDSAYNNYLKCFEAGIPVVSGTTGWLDKIEDIKLKCQNGNTFFYASNFSLGVNLFFKLNRSLAKLINYVEDYDVSITEVHHIEKKDAPSGTAISLAEDILSAFDEKNKWVKCSATENTVNMSELAIHSIREDKVPGIHTIKYESDVDKIEITHSAKSRKGFALGAVLAAEFCQKKSGFLSMNDLLDF